MVDSPLFDNIRQSLRSSLGQNLALSIFAAIVMIEILILVPSYDKRETDLLNTITLKARLLGEALTALPDTDLPGWKMRLGAVVDGERVAGGGVFQDGRVLVHLGELPDIRTVTERTSDARHLLHHDERRLEVGFPIGDRAYKRVLVLSLSTDAIHGELRSYVLRIGGLVMIISGFLTLVTIVVVGRKVLQPLLHLRQVLVSMGPDGSGTAAQRDALSRKDELGEAFRAVEDMRARLAGAHHEILSLARFPAENPSPVLRFSEDGDVLYANDAARNVPGLTTADGQSAGPAISSLIAPAPGNGSANDRPDSLECTLGGHTYAITVSRQTAAGYINLYIADITARVDAQNQLRALNETLEDLVAARTLALEGSELRQRRIIDSMVDGLIVMDEDGIIDNFNPAAERIFGLSEGQAIGQPVTCLMPPEEAIAHPGYIARFLRQRTATILNRPREVIGQHVDGTRIPLSLAVTEVEIAGKSLFIGVVRDISDQKRREQALQEAKDAADAASRAKSDFLATMSHEIRTPMNGVIGMADLLRDTPLDDSQKHQVEVISNSAQALLTIINDILDFSKIETGALELDPAPFDPCALLTAVGQLLEGRALAKGVAIRLELPDIPVGHRLGDEGRLRQVLLNLAGNGLKFTDRGSVTLGLAVPPQPDGGSGDLLRFTVTDTGVGIPQEWHGRLFERFSQGDASTARHHGGTGLGLAISKSLVELMGGTISFESWPGAGAHFWIDVPLPAARIPDIARVVAATPAETAGRALRILVVEDNDINRQVAQGLLTKLGHSVTLAEDGFQGVSLASMESWDLILMDLQMPGMDGLEATRRIRVLPDRKRARVTIVAMTANATEADRIACFDAGMNGYLSKPVTRRRLAEALAGLAENPGIGTDG